MKTESKTEANKVVFELTETNVITRWRCHVCGGQTEKVGVLCEVSEGEWKGWRICETCLENGDADASLTSHIKRLEEYIKSLRLLLGRIKAPTYEDWLKAEGNNEWAIV